MAFSNSEIQVWKDCKRKWYLTYHRHLTPKPETFVNPETGEIERPGRALRIGSLVHMALERYYKSIYLYSESITFEAAANEAIQHAVANAATFEYHVDDSDLELVTIMLTGYFEWLEDTAADADVDIFAVEEPLRAPLLDDGEYVGKIDRILVDKRTGEVWIDDIKTAATLNTPVQELTMNEAMLGYVWLARKNIKHIREITGMPHLTPKDIVGIRYTMLKKVKRTAKAKPPFYHIEKVRVNDAMIASWHARLSIVAADIDETSRTRHDPWLVFTPRPNRDCSWKCPFQHICPHADDGSDIEGMLQSMFVLFDPNERYGSFLNNEEDE